MIENKFVSCHFLLPPRNRHVKTSDVYTTTVLNVNCNYNSRKLTGANCGLKHGKSKLNSISIFEFQFKIH